MRLVLPLPPRVLSPNARVHWSKKATATAEYRAIAAASVRGEARDCRWHRASARLVYYAQDKRRRDKDNILASMKAAFDGLVDAGLLADDSGLTHEPVEIAHDRANPRVEVWIERL